MTTGVLEKPKETIGTNDGVKVVHVFRNSDVVLFRRGMIDEIVSRCGTLRIARPVRVKRPDETVQYCVMCSLLINQK